MYSAVLFSLLVTVYVWLSETLQLVLRNKHYLSDLGLAVGEVLVTYVGFALCVGVVVGAVVRRRRWQCLAVVAVYYAALSLKMFWLDAPLLVVPSMAAAFGLVTLVGATGLVIASRRLELPLTTPILVLIAYFHICQSIAANWATLGGDIVTFLLARRTLIDVALGGACLVLAVFAFRWIERRRARWARWFHAVLLCVLALLVTASSSRNVVGGVPAGASAPSATDPDIYVLSFDALRRDTLERFIADNPSSAFAELVQRGTTFNNIVTEGASTYSILSNNTFAGAARATCRDTIPGLLEARGYASAMLLGRYAKRIQGSHCYDYYYSGKGSTLVRRYSVPALRAAFWGVDARASLRAAFMPSADLVSELHRVVEGLGPRPAFAYLHFLALHAPYVPDDKKHDEAYLADMKRFMQQCYLVACDPALPENARLIRVAREGYEQKLREQDIVVRQVVELAKSRGRNFVVIITADHGELFGEYGGFAHSGGFVRELLNVPFVVYDSRDADQRTRCELMRTSEALRTTVARFSFDPAASYPDHTELPIAAPPLGTAVVNRMTQAIRYEIGAGNREHAGTWRNIHRASSGAMPFTIESCSR